METIKKVSNISFVDCKTHINGRISLPESWLKEMNITKEERSIAASFDDNINVIKIYKSSSDSINDGINKRILNVSFPTTTIKGKKYISPRWIMPMSWIKALGVSQENRSVEISFDGETISIKKA